MIEDFIVGDDGGSALGSETRDECSYCDYIPYFVYCQPTLTIEETCDKQLFGFWQNAILPHWNFNKDHYNKASQELLAPYNFTAYWEDLRDPLWYYKYDGITENSPPPNSAVYKEPVTHQFYERNAYKSLDHPWATTLFF